MSPASSNLGLRARWQRLTDRERRMVGALGGAFVLVLVLGATYFIRDGLATLEQENDEMRQALKDITNNRDLYERNKLKMSGLEVRIGAGGVQLQGLLEAAAKDAGVKIDETTERPVVPAGPKYVERAVDVTLQNVGLEQLARFMRHIETGPNLVIVTALHVTTRNDKHDELQVQMTVSTYEHAPAGKSGPKKETQG